MKFRNGWQISLSVSPGAEAEEQLTVKQLTVKQLTVKQLTVKQLTFSDSLAA